MLEGGPACAVGETTGVACFCEVVKVDVVAATGDCADTVGDVGDIGTRRAVFTVPGTFRASAGAFPATGEICEVVTETASDVDDLCAAAGTCAEPDL